ncbi:phosphoenolpyruvate--protein phosphotransferase [Janibacter sp. UYMM211]|uniref:phosphoenolpyruvate--protein phosphotransferase n=1 Tax=Janibacter sp. UYMM211 TaxID=3156342 RepID=UPI003397F98A
MTTTSETATSPTAVQGTGVVPGVAYARAVWAKPQPEVPVRTEEVPADQRDAEVERLVAAADAVASRLEERAGRVTGVAAEVLSATAGLARDKGWIAEARKRVTKGADATAATVGAVDHFIALFEKLGGVMAERTTDLRDIRSRVVAELEGLPEPGVPHPDHPFVLLAEDLAPADTADLDPALVQALVTSLGGPTSHTSIIARQRGIPCVVAASGLDVVAEGSYVLVDGETGLLEVEPDAEQARSRAEVSAQEMERVRAWRGPAATSDGQRVDLLANVQDGDSAAVAARGQAEGVGLFRTELCFLGRDTEPSVEQQASIYAGVLRAFPDGKVVTRTLDAGSDKPLAFVTQPDEPNPALGVRGARIVQLDAGMMTRQLDALAQAAGEVGRPLADTWVMAPMIATPQEAADFAALVRERGMKPGVMVEVPSVALQAEQVLEHVDFLSIGTNDLSQYTMAADRMAPSLAGLTDPWQPAVLRLVAMTAAAGTAAGKPVGVCGEAAADPALAVVLVGLGITSLSMAGGALPGVGARLAQVSREQCAAAARAALAASSPAQAREAATAALAG